MQSLNLILPSSVARIYFIGILEIELTAFFNPLLNQCFSRHKYYCLVIALALVNLQQTIKRCNGLARTRSHGKQTTLLVVLPIFKSLSLIVART